MLLYVCVLYSQLPLCSSQPQCISLGKLFICHVISVSVRQDADEQEPVSYCFGLSLGDKGGISL
jgi:hypothetical protein